MIRVFGSSSGPARRLLDALALRGHRLSRSDREAGGVERILVLSALGAHPDARAGDLKRLWVLEEQARGSGLPVLTLRLAPLIGPASPLWLRLRSRPRLPRGGRQLLNPVAESDVILTLEHAFSGRAAWEGWFEVAGPETVSLDELRALAEHAGPRLPPGSGAWEPPLEVMAEQRLSEARTWLEHFGIEPRTLGELALAWAA